MVGDKQHSGDLSNQMRQERGFNTLTKSLLFVTAVETIGFDKRIRTCWWIQGMKLRLKQIGDMRKNMV
jgi:hypothetical protein